MLLRLSTDDESRWAAVQNRDTSADGHFVYAVASTRIYCRPSCPSRRPHRRHVRFFLSPADAEAEGYRACRRCGPREPETAAIADMISEVLMDIKNVDTLAKVRHRVRELTARFPLPY